MNQLFTEAIKIKDGIIFNLFHHQERINRTLNKFSSGKINLSDALTNIPDFVQKGLFKCRILYDSAIRQIEFIPYEVRKEGRVGIILNDAIEYSFKYADRSTLENLIKNTDFDDAVIIKNGCVTDALFCNLVFESDEGLFTPNTYLLPGTKRRLLIDNQIITERSISLQDISSYKKIYFINSMIDLEDDIYIKTSSLNIE